MASPPLNSSANTSSAAPSIQPFQASIRRRLAVWGTCVLGACGYIGLAAPSLLEVLSIGLGLLLLAVALLVQLLLKVQRQVVALNLQADSIKENSFNLTANQLLLDELMPLGQALTSMTHAMASQRANLYQRELLLDTVLQTSPSALILTDSQGRVLMTNPASRQLLAAGKRFDGEMLTTVLAQSPALLEACRQQQSGLIQVNEDSIWHLSISQFHLNQQQHGLYLLKPMTREFQREEIKAWKKLIRVIGHELNNSLAPMSSLAFSGARILQQPASADSQQALADIFSHLANRSQQLNQFLQGYLEFARTPPPKLQRVQWPALINQWQDFFEFELVGALPEKPWYIDESQLSQVLLNLLKNSKEAGASEQGTKLTIIEQPLQLQLLLSDDAGGMSVEVLQHALVPFYSTKVTGSGVGLALCREIMDAHGGTLELVNLADGLQVRLTFPRRSTGDKTSS